MTVRRGRLVAASLILGVIVLPSASSAQSGKVVTPAPPTAGRVLTPAPPVAEQQWTSVQCGACQKAGISLEFRQLPDAAHDVNGFVVARVRNLTQRGVAGSIEVMEDDLPDSEGHIRSQQLWFVLGPTGNEKGEQIVLLRHSTPVQVIVHDVAQW